MREDKKTRRGLAAGATLVAALLAGLLWCVSGEPHAMSNAASDGADDGRGAASAAAAAQRAGAGAGGARAGERYGSEPGSGASEVRFHEPPVQAGGHTAVYAEAPAHPTPPDQLAPPPIHVDPNVRGRESAAWSGVH